jgi:hypothetical protein
MDDELFLRMIQQNAAGGMFGRTAEPRNALDLNLGLFGNNPLVSMGAQGVMDYFQVFKKLGMAPGEFFPSGTNLFDQMEAKQYWSDRKAAMDVASAADRVTYTNMLRGLARMTGRPMGLAQERAASNLAGMISGAMPFVSAFLGPEMVDALHGSRGSAAVMAQFLHRGGRFAVDPVTGRTGWSGETAGNVARTIQEQFFGPGGDLAAMRGMTAGQAGALYDELNQAGLMGMPIGALSEPRQFDRISADRGFMQRAVARIGRDQPDLHARLVDEFAARRGGDIKGRGAVDQDQLLAGTQEDARKVLEQVKQFGSDDTVAQVKRDFDAQRIGDRLKDLAGVTSAMRDIFGDAGHPNAPMKEIVAGLNMLTQQGMVTMSPADLERSVRLTQALAKSSGIGMAGMQQLMASGASMADALGIERGFAVTSAQGAAAFGTAFRQIGAGDVPHWQGRSPEQMTLLDQRLRMQAANSGLANQLGTAARIAEALTEQNQAVNPALRAMLDAAHRGEEEFVNPLTGAKETTMMAPGRFEQFMGQAGVDPNTLALFRRQTGANREFVFREGYDALVRRQQPRDIAMFMAQSYRPGIEGALVQNMQNLGLSGPQATAAARTAAAAAASAIQNMDSETLKNDTKRNEIVAGAIRQSLEGEKVDVGRLRAEDFTLMAEGGWGAWHQRVLTDPAVRGLGTGLGGAQAMNKQLLDRQRVIDQEARVSGEIRSQLAGIAGSGPIERIMDMLESPPKDLKTAIGKALGAHDPNQIIDLMGGLANLSQNELGRRGITDRDLVGIQTVRIARLAAAFRKEQAVDPKTDAEREQHAQRLQMISGELRAHREGGAAATQQLDVMLKNLNLTRDDIPGVIAGTRGLTMEQREQMAALWASEQKGLVNRAADAGIAGVGAKVGRKDIEEVVGAAERFTRAQTKGQKDEVLRQATLFADLGGRRLDALLDDPESLKALGGGGFYLAKNLKEKQFQLQELADVMTKGDVGKLIASGNTEAKGLMDDITKGMRDIARRQGGDGKPLAPIDKVEEAAAKEYRDREMREDKVQNRDMIDRVAREIGGDKLSDAERDKLAAELGEGSGAVVARHKLARQLQARKDLEALATSEGMDPVKMREAIREDRLDEYTSKLKKPGEAENFVRWAKEAGSILRLGDDGVSPEHFHSALDDARRHAEAIKDRDADLAGKKDAQKIVGTLELTDPHHVLLTAHTDAAGANSTPVAAGRH